jgi:hypothetical protein
MTKTYIRHVVLFKFRPDATAEDKTAMQDGLAALPSAIPELLRYSFGPDLGLAQGNYDFAIVADVANREDFRTYVEHPRHQDTIVRLIRPIIAERTAVQIEVEA